MGAGALGSFLGAALSSENEVVLIARAAHAAAIRKNGLRIEGITEGQFEVDATSRVTAAADAEVVLLTTKAYDTRAAARELQKVGGTAPVLTLQNGLTNIPTLLRELPARPILGGSTTHGVTMLRPGAIRHAGAGDTYIGAARADETLVASTVKLFTAVGIQAQAAKDLTTTIWQKAVVSAAINPVTAVLGQPNGEVLRRPETMLLSQSAAREAAAVGKAHGAHLHGDPWPAVARVLKATADNRSSMLQDIEAGRRTEIDAINGEIVRLGRVHKVRTPVNASLVALVKAL